MNFKGRRWLLGMALAGLAVPAISPVFAQGDKSLETMSQDANQWVVPLGDYAGTRHSTLKQINADNVGKLRVAWTMSTGALRGHEGQPLIIGDMMYFES